MFHTPNCVIYLSDQLEKWMELFYPGTFVEEVFYLNSQSILLLQCKQSRYTEISY